MKRELTVNDSSQILRMGWDPEEEILVVEFLAGRVYRYRFVNKDIFAALASADSVGKMFSETIRFNSMFPFEEIGGWPD